ncbi:MAG: hypothetical protein ACRDNO_34655 [Trebonia sp.]
MSRIESRIKQFTARLSQWWNSRSGGLKQSATDGAQRAASRARDFRESERGQRAASKLSDLRTSEPAKKAEAAFNDLRGTDAAKKAENAISDLRQREPLKKAEESARKVMHDLFSSGSGGSGTTGDAS